MCLMLYLGVSKPMTPFRHRTENHQVILRRTSRKQLPTQIVEKAHCYFIADYDCSCIFLPGGPGCPLDEYTIKARERLIEIADAALKIDQNALLFSEWLGDAPDSGPIERQVSPSDFAHDRVWEGVSDAHIFYHLSSTQRATP